MKYAGQTFTLYADEPLAVQGSDSLYTYQNTGTGTAIIQGSNSGTGWVTIATILANAVSIVTHSYTFLRMTGSTQVSVSRGVAGGQPTLSGAEVSSSNPLPVLSTIDYRTSQVAAAINDRAYKAWVTRAGAASKYSAVQLWNPVNSGYTLLVAVVQGFNSAGTIKWYPLLNTTALTTADGFASPLKAGQDAASFEMRSELLDAKTANNSLGVTVSSTTTQGASIIMTGEFYILTEGSGIRFEADVVNVGMNLLTTVIQIPNAAM